MTKKKIILFIQGTRCLCGVGIVSSVSYERNVHSKIILQKSYSSHSRVSLYMWSVYRKIGLNWRTYFDFLVIIFIKTSRIHRHFHGCVKKALKKCEKCTLFWWLLFLYRSGAFPLDQLMLILERVKWSRHSEQSLLSLPKIRVKAFTLICHTNLWSCHLA